LPNTSTEQVPPSPEAAGCTKTGYKTWVQKTVMSPHYISEKGGSQKKQKKKNNTTLNKKKEKTWVPATKKRKKNGQFRINL